jgi:hypothetical protein
MDDRKIEISDAPEAAESEPLPKTAEEALGPQVDSENMIPIEDAVHQEQPTSKKKKGRPSSAARS